MSRLPRIIISPGYAAGFRFNVISVSAFIDGHYRVIDVQWNMIGTRNEIEALVATASWCWRKAWRLNVESSRAANTT